jgi:hypothetical protein
MIPLIAFRNIIYRPWRSALLFFGYGIGVAVMIALLSVGEALLTQARDEKLVGGGDITVLPQGLDVEVMKTGGIGGLFFSIDQARFIYQQLLASPRLQSSISTAAPQIDGRLVYLTTSDGRKIPAKAAGEIPSLTRAVRGPASLRAGAWTDDEGDRRWVHPSLAELRHDIDHFHVPPDTADNRETWAEWHYFNVLSPDKKKWAFISYIVAGDVTSEKWGGSLTVTLREEGKESRKFEMRVPKQRVAFSTSRADLRIGDASVTVTADGDYHITGRTPGKDGAVAIDLVVHPAPRAYFPGASLGSDSFVSGYTVPALRATASGSICVANRCDRYGDVQAYHDHNWGVWRGVTWDWGASRAGPYTILYGRVITADSKREQPLFVYVVDSLGFRAVMRPATISYVDGRTTIVDGRTIDVPSRAVFADVRGADSLRVELDIEDAIATDMRQQSESIPAFGGPYFIQMKGTATISGRLNGERVAGRGTGFFETYR